MTGNDDDFFGGSITPRPVTPPEGGPNPHLAHSKEYGSFAPAAPSTAPSASSNLPLAVGIVAVLGVLIFGFVGYRMYFAPTFSFPDELVGMERLDPDSDLGKAVERSWKQAESTFPGDFEVEMAMYTSGASMLLVAAGDAGTSDLGSADTFFAALSQGMAQQSPQLTFVAEEAGPQGGQMQCATQVTTGICAWVDDDTFGVVVTSGLTTDSAETARTVRDAVQH